MPVTTKVSEPEPAGAWFRVSSGGQDEANQEPDVLGHCAGHGYDVKRRYEVHAKSASKGEQQAALDQMLSDMRAGIITVLVCWHSDRIERRPAKKLLDLLEEVSGAGGRVESVQEPMLGKLDMGSQLMTFVSGIMNHEKSRHLAEQVGLAHERIRENMALQGRPPWGFTTGGTKYNRTLLPAPEGLAYARRIFERVARGDSLATVARWLDAEGVKPAGRSSKHEGWWPKSLNQLIRNPAYMGLRCAQDARTKRYGKVLHRCDPLVDADLWKDANARLDAKPKRGARLEHRAMLTGVIYCPRCEDSPMYRIHGGRGFYYRCTGRGPQRKGCGNLVPLEAVDRAVCAVAEQTFRWRKVTVSSWVPGTDYRAEIERVKLERAHLDQEAGDYDDRHAELTAKLKALKLLPSTPGYWEQTETDQTYADIWEGLAEGERGDWLAKQGFRVEATREQVQLTQPGRNPLNPRHVVKLPQLAEAA